MNLVFLHLLFSFLTWICIIRSAILEGRRNERSLLVVARVVLSLDIPLEILKWISRGDKTRRCHW